MILVRIVELDLQLEQAQHFAAQARLLDYNILTE